MSADAPSEHRSRLDDLPAAGLVKARAWDVLGAALGAPMIVWGLLSWFGVAGDEGGGVPGFFSGCGASAIGLVLAASGYSLNQILSGRPHDTAAPPVSAFLASAAAIVIIGAMIAKPDSSTIEAGSVAGLITAALQASVMTLGWTKGSGKTVRASRVQAFDAKVASADRLAHFNQAQARLANRYGAGAYGPAPTWGQPQYGQPQYGQPQYGGPYPQSAWNQPPAQQQPNYPQQPYPQQPYSAVPSSPRPDDQRPPDWPQQSWP